MASHRIVVLAAVLALGASGAAAQTPDEPTPEQTAVACAPPPLVAFSPADAARVIGSQDAVARSVFGMPELLVTSGGTDRGVQLGQQYFIRRIVRTGETYRDKLPHTVHTSGWARVVAVNATTAIVSVDHACADILEGDYLEPYQLPVLPAGDIAAVDTTGEPDFTSFSHILYAADERQSAGVGEFMLIDRGVSQNVALGARFAIYRDLRRGGVPLASVGEAMVVSVGQGMALIRINRARDAIFAGDFVVPRSK
jgi:hypothetical protein